MTQSCPATAKYRPQGDQRIAQVARPLLREVVLETEGAVLCTESGRPLESIDPSVLDKLAVLFWLAKGGRTGDPSLRREEALLVDGASESFLELRAELPICSSWARNTLSKFLSLELLFLYRICGEEKV